MDIKKLIEERTKTNGDFCSHALTAQQLKAILRCSAKWGSLPYAVKESLEMIMHKVARITNGSWEHLDSWHDIQGYSELIAKELEADLPF